MASNDDSEKRNEKGQFSKGSAGRKKGARNRLHADFIVALEKHWHEVGNAAIDIVFKESPRDYLKIMVSVFPKEFVIEDGRVESMSDEELTGYLDELRRTIRNAGPREVSPGPLLIGSGAKETVN